MTVYFIGAGPGDPDLLTIKGRDAIMRCPVCLYAGSLVPEAVVAHAPEDALVMDTAAMNLDEIMAEIEKAHENEQDVARVHSGDPSLYGAIAEQIKKLDYLSIDYEIIPGVPAYAAAAAILKKELTLPDVGQSIILTRTAVRASGMPEHETLTNLGQSKATMAIHLSINNLVKVIRELSPIYGLDCPTVIIARATWPDQVIIKGTLGDIRDKVKKEGITRTALILVGEVLRDDQTVRESMLYDAKHHHVLRPREAKAT